MKTIRTILGALLLFAVVAYLVLMIVNWQDAEPSAAVLRFEAMLAERPVVPDAENAYVLLMGMDSGPDADPLARGIEQRDFLLAAYGPGGDRTLPAPADLDWAAHRNGDLEPLFTDCAKGKPGCRAALQTHQGAIQGALKQAAWQLGRYRELLGRRAWQEPLVFAIDAPIPAYLSAFDGQRLLLLKAWVQAGDGDAEAVRLLLSEDVRFWRMALRESELLLSKMFAAATLERHFAWGARIIQRLPPSNIAKGIPAAWRDAVSSEERSLELAVEYGFSAALIAGALNQAPGLGGLIRGMPFERELSFADRLLGVLLNPLFKPQDAINRQTARLMEAYRAVVRPYPEIPGALRPLLARDDLDSMDPVPSIGLYNPVGDLLLGLEGPSYADYAARVVDLEGLRRAALARVEMHAQGVAPERAQQWLSAHELKNPYNGEPFEWIPGDGGILFRGLAEGDAGRHRFP